MPTVEEYLTELDEQRDKLANFLTAKGIKADENEKLNTLVPKVLAISGDSNKPVNASIAITTSAEAITGVATIAEVPEEVVRTVLKDADGYILKDSNGYILTV